MLASLALLVGLPLALAAEHPSCAPLVPVTFDNTTIPGVSPALSLSSPFLSASLAVTGAGRGYEPSQQLSAYLTACPCLFS